jgi:hypothetical protein
MPGYEDITSATRKIKDRMKIGEMPNLENPAQQEDSVPGYDIPAPIKAKISKSPLPQSRSDK